MEDKERIKDAEEKIRESLKNKALEDIANNSDIILTCLPDVSTSMEIFVGDKGLIKYVNSNHLLVDHSTVDINTSKHCYESFKKIGASFLDAPISGGPLGASGGTLAIMVGGSADDFEQAKPLFDILGKSAILCGKHGAGQVTKLANQICVGANIHALAEALALAAKSGVNPETVYKAIQGGLAGSNVINAKAPMMVDRNFEPGFRIELHYKDINNAMEAARDLNIPLQVTANLQQVLTSLVTKGEGKSDHSAIAKHVEGLAGVEIKKH